MADYCADARDRVLHSTSLNALTVSIRLKRPRVNETGHPPSWASCPTYKSTARTGPGAKGTPRRTLAEAAMQIAESDPTHYIVTWAKPNDLIARPECHNRSSRFGLGRHSFIFPSSDGLDCGTMERRRVGLVNCSSLLKQVNGPNAHGCPPAHVVPLVRLLPRQPWLRSLPDPGLPRAPRPEAHCPITHGSRAVASRDTGADALPRCWSMWRLGAATPVAR